MVRRERNEKEVLVNLFAALFGKAFSVDQEQLKAMLEVYSQELHQTRYNPAILGKARRAARAKAVAAKTDEQLLAKVDKLTVKDDELPPLPPKKRRRR